MLLHSPDDEPFATGAMPYSYRPIGDRDPTLRLMLGVAIEGVLTSAAVDTGAPYLICAPSVARQIRPHSTAALERSRILIRGVSVRGGLYVFGLTLSPLRGDGLTVDVIAFVPDAGYAEVWGTLPSFLGTQGCLDRLRFAVDPATDTFYVGPLSRD
ncbi:MAG: hypothetical protein NT169_25735 [Chloroflexi bacterium]|nr:hypothetical protein [Chloroflexota bacterium]